MVRCVHFTSMLGPCGVILVSLGSILRALGALGEGGESGGVEPSQEKVSAERRKRRREEETRIRKL